MHLTFILYRYLFLFIFFLVIYALASAVWAYDSPVGKTADSIQNQAVSPAKDQKGVSQARNRSDASRLRQSNGVRPQDLDASQNRIITRSEWRGNTQSFMNMDKNGDGILSGEELRRDNFNPSQDDLNNRFGVLDKNANEALSLDEWLGTRFSFEDVDANDNDIISREEFYAYYDNPNDPSVVFLELDRNNDDMVERDTEWPTTKEAFDDLDDNDNHKLDRKEFLSLDKNKDGNLDRNERAFGTIL